MTAVSLDRASYDRKAIEATVKEYVNGWSGCQLFWRLQREP
jgi:hypothetical protein